MIADFVEGSAAAFAAVAVLAGFLAVGHALFGRWLDK